MKSLPIVRLTRSDVSLALELWFSVNHDLAIPVIDHAFQEDCSASVLLAGEGAPARKTLDKCHVGEGLQLWLDLNRPDDGLQLVEFLPEADGSALVIFVTTT